jgi:hypothetical protein
LTLRAISGLTGDIGNRHREVLGDGFRLAVMGCDGAGHRDGKAKQVAAMMVRIFMGFLRSPYRLGFRSPLFPPGLAGLLIIVIGIGAKHAVALWMRAELVRRRTKTSTVSFTEDQLQIS